MLSVLLWTRTIITRLFGQFIETSEGKKPISRIFKNTDFGYRTITVKHPLRDENRQIVLVTKGKPQPDTNLRGTENAPLNEDVEDYFKQEVLPHVPDAWVDHDKTRIGYEIPFNRRLSLCAPWAHLELSPDVENAPAQETGEVDEGIQS